MIRDNELILASAFSPTASGTTVATNVLDTAPLATSPFSNLNSHDLGAGEEIWLEILTVTAPTTATSSTLNFQFVTASAAALTSATVLAEFGALVYTTFTAGSRKRVALPSATYKQYVGVQVVVSDTLTAGTFAIYIIPKIDSYRAYAAGFKLDA